MEPVVVFLDAKEILFHDDWLADRVAYSPDQGILVFLLLDDGRLLVGHARSHLHLLALAVVPREEIACQIRSVWQEETPTFSMPCIHRVCHEYRKRVPAAGTIRKGSITAWESGSFYVFTPEGLKSAITKALKPFLREEREQHELRQSQLGSEQASMST